MLQGYTKQRFNYTKSHLDNKNGLCKAFTSTSLPDKYNLV